MNTETMNVLIVSVLIPFLVAFVALFQQFAASKSAELKVKMHNDEIAKYVDIAEDAVITAVGAVSQVLVDSLKDLAENGQLTEEQKELAFTEAKHRALLIMGIAAKAAVTELYGSFDDWINNKIDYYVGLNKTAKAAGVVLLRPSQMSRGILPNTFVLGAPDANIHLIK